MPLPLMLSIKALPLLMIQEFLWSGSYVWCVGRKGWRLLWKTVTLKKITKKWMLLLEGGMLLNIRVKTRASFWYFSFLVNRGANAEGFTLGTGFDSHVPKGTDLSIKEDESTHRSALKCTCRNHPWRPHREKERLSCIWSMYAKPIRMILASCRPASLDLMFPMIWNHHGMVQSVFHIKKTEQRPFFFSFDSIKC